VASETQQVVAFVNGEPGAAGECIDHLYRRLRACASLESGEIVGRHVRKIGDFLSSEADGATTGSTSHPDVFGLQCLAAGADETPNLDLVHVSAAS